MASGSICNKAMLIPYLYTSILKNAVGEFFQTQGPLTLNEAQKAILQSVLVGRVDLDDIGGMCGTAWARDPERVRRVLRRFMDGPVGIGVGQWEPPGRVDIVIVDQGWQGIYQHAVDLWHLLNRKYCVILIAPEEPPYGFDPALENRLITPGRLNAPNDGKPVISCMSIARTLVQKLKPRLLYLQHRAVMPYFSDIAEEIPTVVHGDMRGETLIAVGKHMSEDRLDMLSNLQRLYFAEDLGTNDLLTEAIGSYWTSKRAKELWFWSDEQREMATRSHGELAERFQVVLPLIDADYFSPGDNDGEEPVVLFSTTNLGAKVGTKGLDPLAKVIDDLPAQTRLQIVVNRRRDVSPAVHARPGVEVFERVPKTEMLNVYRRARAYCRISRDDSSPVSVMEAMVTGVPVMVSPGIARNIPIIVDGHNGFVVNPEDTAEITAKLRLLIESRELRMEMGRFARRAALPYSFQMNHWMFDRYMEEPGEAVQAQ